MKSNKKALIFSTFGIVLLFGLVQSKIIHNLHISDIKRASIKQGLTQDEVHRILGKPDLVQDQNKIWTYQPILNIKGLTVGFDDQKIVRYTYELD